MVNPFRGVTDKSTYFISANCVEKKFLLQSHRMAGLLVEVLLHYRSQNKYLLHEFVVMPNHFHLLITPSESTLEKCMQFIKGGFSFRAKKELKFIWTIWQSSFHDRRMRNMNEYQKYQRYINSNPVSKKLCMKPEDWEYSSVSGKYLLDPVPKALQATDLQNKQ